MLVWDQETLRQAISVYEQYQTFVETKSYDPWQKLDDSAKNAARTQVRAKISKPAVDSEIDRSRVRAGCKHPIGAAGSIAARRVQDDELVSSGHRRRGLCRLVVGHVEEVQEIARAVFPLQLQAQLMGQDRAAMARRRDSVDVAQIVFAAHVTHYVDRLGVARSERQLAEIESLLEIEVAIGADDLADDVCRENLCAAWTSGQPADRARQGFDRSFAGDIE